MTSREMVQASLAFAGPPRIPYGMGGGFPSDLRYVSREGAPNSRARGWERREGYWDMVDEWGNEWRRVSEKTAQGEVSHGALEDSWELLESYDWPRTGEPQLYERARHQCREYHEQGYYVLGSMGWPFAISRYLRRMENFLADVAGEPEMVGRLLGKVTDLLEVEIYRLAEAGVDGVMTCEDWGTQDRLLVHPRTFRTLFGPCFQRLCGAARSRGLTVWLHSCGHVTEVIEDWVGYGIAVCQFDQPELHGIDYLAQRWGGRLHFWCPVDIQKTLQTRELARIERAAREYVEQLGCFGGGFIAGYYGSNEGIGMDPEIQAIACRAFMKYGDPAPIRRRA